MSTDRIVLQEKIYRVYMADALKHRRNNVGTDEGRRKGTMTAEDIENRDHIEAYESLCNELRDGPAQVALDWLSRNSVVTVDPPKTSRGVSSGEWALHRCMPWGGYGFS